MTNKEKTIKGNKIIELLGLKTWKAYAQDEESIRVKTSWGDKTPLGLYESINRILTDR